MDIVKLTQDNVEQYGYGCMMKGNIYVRQPQPYRQAALPNLKEHVNNDVFGFVAVDEGQPVGHLLIGAVDALGVPVRVQPETPVILCTYINHGYGRKGLGQSLIEAAKKAFQDAPGLLILSTKTRMYMPFQQFKRFGFKMIHAYDMWRIGYLPIKQNDIQIEFFEPELEWDYVKPFTWIRGGYCPFLLHVWNVQKKAAESFKQYAPVEEMTLEEARKKDAKAVPGFYIFGKVAPARPMFGWQFKQYIRKAIRQEEKKTFGAAAPTGYEKRKR